MWYPPVAEVKKNGYHHRHINTDKTIHIIGMDLASAERQVGVRKKKLSNVFVPSSSPLHGCNVLLWSFPAIDIPSSALPLFFTAGIFGEPGERSFHRGDNTLKPNFSTQSCGENITFIVK